MELAKVKLDDSVIKMVMYIVIVLVIIYYLNRFIAGSKQLFGGVLGDSPEKKIEIEKEAKKGISNATITNIDGKVSYTRETFVRFAAKLYDANTRFLFDSQSVKDVFNVMKTVADIKFLIQIYGIKEGMNLIQYLRKVIPRENYIGLSINDINEILKKRKINYAF